MEVCETIGGFVGKCVFILPFSVILFILICCEIFNYKISCTLFGYNCYKLYQKFKFEVGMAYVDTR